MNVKAALLRNTLWYGLVTFIGLAAGLLMSIVLARGLGPARMGEYSYLLWAMRTMTAVASLGFALATVRYGADAFARGDANGAWGYVRLFLRGQIVTTFVVVAVLIPCIFAFSEQGLRWSFIVIALSLFPVTVEAIYTHAVYGAQRYDVTTQTSTVKMAMQLLTSLLLVVLGFGVLGLFVGIALSYVASCLLQRRRALEIYQANTAATPATVNVDLRAYFIPLSVVAVLDAIVWDRSEVFFLRMYTSTEQIAFYSLAFGLTTKIMVIPEIAVGALLPAFSALYGSNAPEEFARLYRTALKYVALAGAPLAAVLAGLGPGLIAWLYGEEYLPAAALLGALAAVGLVSALRKVAWAALRAVGDRRCALHATLIAASLNIGLAALLIPAYGTTGAVIANTASQVLATTWVFVGMTRTHHARFPLADQAKIAGAALLAFATTWSVAAGGHDLGWLLTAAGAGLAVFFTTAVLAGVIGVREWSLLITSTRRIMAPRATGA
jgi:O-antigen/teichoic acid export membrane protein